MSAFQLCMSVCLFVCVKFSAVKTLARMIWQDKAGGDKRQGERKNTTRMNLGAKETQPPTRMPRSRRDGHLSGWGEPLRSRAAHACGRPPVQQGFALLGFYFFMAQGPGFVPALLRLPFRNLWTYFGQQSHLPNQLILRFSLLPASLREEPLLLHPAL